MNSKRKVASSSSPVTLSQPSKQFLHDDNKSWSTGLFDCTNDVPLCCCAFLFLPCFLCFLDKNSREFAMTSNLIGGIPGLAINRTKIRASFQIQGSLINDWFLSCVCRSQPERSALVFEKQWSSGLCDCCTDCKQCCLAFWCLPCFLCCLDSSAKECCFSTIGISLLCGACTGLAMLRAKLRGTYRLDGSIIEDFCYAHCCPCCTALQVKSELKYRGEIID